MAAAVAATAISLLLRPLCISTSTTLLCKCLRPSTALHNTTLFSLPTRPLLFCRSLSALPESLSSPNPLNPSALSSGEEEEEEEEDDGDDELDEVELGGGRLDLTVAESSEKDTASSELKRKWSPSLSVKEKKELVSYAHGLGKKLKCQLVGKSGVTNNVAVSFSDTLEANELLKIKIHRSCPGELEDVVKQLEEVTGSVVVGRIGRTVIIYRPSLTRLKTEEKKKQAERDFVRKQPKWKPTSETKGQVPRRSGLGGRRQEPRRSGLGGWRQEPRRSGVGGRRTPQEPRRSGLGGRRVRRK